MMKAEDVIEIYNFLEQNSIEIFIDGGWAIDALVGKQNREHSDLDIAISHDQVEKLRDILALKGFQEEFTDDRTDYNFVLVDDKGRKIDVHSFLLDENGKNTYGIGYQKEDLEGKGKIIETIVKCISTSSLLKFHTGYEVDETDYFDMKLLCEKYGFEIPKEYHKFIKD